MHKFSAMFSSFSWFESNWCFYHQQKSMHRIENHRDPEAFFQWDFCDISRCDPCQPGRWYPFSLCQCLWEFGLSMGQGSSVWVNYGNSKKSRVKYITPVKPVWFFGRLFGAYVWLYGHVITRSIYNGCKGPTLWEEGGLAGGGIILKMNWEDKMRW